jgi:Holliday junction DNA helicase RuvB
MTSIELSDVAKGFNKVKLSLSVKDYIGQSRAKNIIKMHIASLDKKPTTMTPEAAEYLGESALGIPRLVGNFRLHASARAGELSHSTVELGDAKYALALLGVDKNGLMPIDRRLVKYLLARDNKAVGVNALAAVCGCSKRDITEMVVPRMSYANMLTRNNRSMLELTKEAMNIYETNK